MYCNSLYPHFLFFIFPVQYRTTTTANSLAQIPTSFTLAAVNFQVPTSLLLVFDFRILQSSRVSSLLGVYICESRHEAESILRQGLASIADKVMVPCYSPEIDFKYFSDGFVPYYVAKEAVIYLHIGMPFSLLRSSATSSQMCASHTLTFDSELAFWET